MANKYSIPGIQVHIIWGPLKIDDLRIWVTVEVEGNLLIQNTDGKPGPGHGHRGHDESGRLIWTLRVRLGVVEDNMLLAVFHCRQLHTNIHDVMGWVSDGEYDARLGGRGFYVENEGEITVERAGQVGRSWLSNIGFWAKHIARAVVMFKDFGDAIRWRIAN